MPPKLVIDYRTKIDLIREKLDEIEMDTSPAEYLMDYK